MRIKTKNNRTNLAVCEIVGTILMLGIATSSFSVVYYQVVTTPTPTPSPIVEISGTVDENNIVLMHRGGEPLSLDTEFLIDVGGKSMSLRVGDFLDDESKEDGEWNLGEQVVYNVFYNFDYLEYPYGDINVVDGESNTLLMAGVVGVEPVCDLGIEITVDNQFPGMETNIVFTINVTNNGNINETGIKIKFEIPEGLTHYKNTTTQGTYKNSTGVWDVGNLNSKQFAVLIIEVTIGERGSEETTQLVMLLDGSGSIASGDWTLQVEGLAGAVENDGTFPHDGTVELTIIQFGGGHWDFPFNPGYAKVEIGPVVINEANYASIADNIRKLIQLNGMTPTACGIYLGADTVVKSSIFSNNIRQVIMLVTDGDPTQKCDCDGDYQADEYGSGTYKTSAEAARNYLINTLGLTVDQDEFNAIAVGNSAPHASWLKEEIVWPEPSYYAPPFLIGSPHRGWLRNVTTWEEFAETIDECFGIIFNQVPVRVNISSKSFSDPKIANDFDTMTIVPTSSPYVTTLDATDIEGANATLNMYFNFKWAGSGEVRFAYIESDDNDSVLLKSVDDADNNYLYTPWESKSGAGTYSKKITGLSSNVNLIFRAQLKYDDIDYGITTVNVKEETFTTAVKDDGGQQLQQL